MAQKIKRRKKLLKAVESFKSFIDVTEEDWDIEVFMQDLAMFTERGLENLRQGANQNESVQKKKRSIPRTRKVAEK